MQAWQERLYDVISTIPLTLDFMVIGSTIHAYHKQDKIPKDVDLLINKEDIEEFINILGMTNLTWQTRNKSLRIRGNTKWGSMDLYTRVADLKEVNTQGIIARS